MELKENETLEDLMIDGLKIIQSKDLYRFTSDAVILSKFATHKKGDFVADFCSGSGIVGLHYYALHKDVKRVYEYEIQPELADLNKRSIEYNKLEEIFTCENIAIQEIKSDMNGKFSLILCNPPYKKKDSGIVSDESHISICKHEIKVTLNEIIEIASKKLSHGGRLCLCQKPERLTDTLVSMRENGIEPSRLQFCLTKNGSIPYLFLVEGVKGVKPQLKILPDLVN